MEFEITPKKYKTNGVTTTSSNIAHPYTAPYGAKISVDQYYLEISLSEDVDSIWEQCFREVQNEHSFPRRTTGAPNIIDLELRGNIIITLPFPKRVENEVKDFLKEFDQFIKAIDNRYKIKLQQLKQKKIQEEKKKHEDDAKLEELSKKLGL